MTEKGKAYIIIAQDVFGMSNRELAEVLGITVQTLGEWGRKGKHQLSLEQFDKLEKAIQSRIDNMNSLIEAANVQSKQ